MDQLSNLKAFARVVATGSFSEAARRLRTSKSLISRQIAALEAELGVRLFHRTTRSLSLTDEGRSYHEQVVRILAELEEADRSISQLRATPRGRLRVNAPMSFGFLHLAPAVPDFLARYPEVELDVTMNDRYVDLVDEGFDVAIRLGRLADSSLVARRLAPMRRVVCASPYYFERHGIPARPEELRDHRCLAYSLNTPVDEWRFADADGRPISVEIRGPLRANNGDILRTAAIRDLGIVNLPSFIIGNDLRLGSLVSILEPFLVQDAGVHAVYPHSRHLSAKVRAFVDFLAERCGPVPYWDS